MNVYEMNAVSLAKELGVPEIPEIYVIVAKHQVMGMDDSQIAEILSCDPLDVIEVTKEEVYKSIRSLIAGAHAESTAEQTTGWDAIEGIAIKSLVKRLPFEKDSEFLLKVAAVANRATRKHAAVTQNVLDPGLRAGRTTITLTQRLVSKINGRGEELREETKQLSIQDGSMSNPSFQEIDSLLSVRNAPVLPRAVDIKTHTAEPTEDELFEQFMKN